MPKKIIWTDAQEATFQNIKRLVSEDVMLHFPNHSQPFHIYTDASNYQIGATIKQNQLPIAYFSRNLTPTQRRYSTIEQEIIAVNKFWYPSAQHYFIIIKSRIVA